MRLPASTSSGAPSETASATAVATDASSGSATPSPVITRGYSGGSKAPDGEYRKADAYGPAQNVPKPPNRKKYPETQEGALDMMNDWTISHNYAVQTGNCQYAKSYVKKETDEDKFYEYVERLYKRGGWIINGLDKYQLEGQFIYDEKFKEYTLMLKHIWEYAMYVEPDGSYTEDANTAEGDDNGALYSQVFRWVLDNRWFTLPGATERKRVVEIVCYVLGKLEAYIRSLLHLSHYLFLTIFLMRAVRSALAIKAMLCASRRKKLLNGISRGEAVWMPLQNQTILSHRLKYKQRTSE